MDEIYRYGGRALREFYKVEILDEIKFLIGNKGYGKKIENLDMLSFLVLRDYLEDLRGYSLKGESDRQRELVGFLYEELYNYHRDEIDLRHLNITELEGGKETLLHRLTIAIIKKLKEEKETVTHTKYGEREIEGLITSGLRNGQVTEVREDGEELSYLFNEIIKEEKPDERGVTREYTYNRKYYFNVEEGKLVIETELVEYRQKHVDGEEYHVTVRGRKYKQENGKAVEIRGLEPIEFKNKGKRTQSNTASGVKEYAHIQTFPTVFEPKTISETLKRKLHQITKELILSEIIEDKYNKSKELHQAEYKSFVKELNRYYKENELYVRLYGEPEVTLKEEVLGGINEMNYIQSYHKKYREDIEEFKTKVDQARREVKGEIFVNKINEQVYLV